jgi:alkylated DNA nucleotide flippase Atl1
VSISTDAESRLARSVAAALVAFADELDAARPEEDLRTPSDIPVLDQEHSLGKRQRQIVNLSGLTTESGMRTAEIATEIEYQVPNTYSTLQALTLQGIVEQVPGKEPQHWRLARRYRPNSEAFMRMAGRVRRGEWTTYGDISIAVLGNHNAARGVGRAAATIPEFPTPHRVLLEGGIIAPNWRTSDGKGPEECRRRLGEEGVGFEEGDRADRKARVAWDELMRRDAAASVA